MPVNHLEAWIARCISLPRKTILSRTPLRQWQHQRLVQTIALARKYSPWYRQRLHGLEIPEGHDVSQILAALPLMNAADLRQHGQDMLCCSQADIQRVITLHSSGTSAAPKRIFLTSADLEQTLGFFEYGMRLVAAAEARVLVMLPSCKDNDVGTLLVQALESGHMSARPQWPAHDPHIAAQAAQDLQATCLVGLPQHILPLARDPELGPRLSGLVDSVLLCSDYAAPCVRRAIAENLDCRVHLHYGSTESGLGGAVECSNGAGCHIRENDLLFEVIDPQTGQQVPEGTDGELVLTTLTRNGMPLIRYRTGDWGRLNTRRCACGSILARLDNLHGRLDNVLHLPGGGGMSLAEMDQAVLTLEDVVAYTAHLLPLRQPQAPYGEEATAPGTELALDMTTTAHPRADILDRIRLAVRKIPALERALTTKRLALTLSRTEDNPHQSHTVKRTFGANQKAGLEVSVSSGFPRAGE